MAPPSSHVLQSKDACMSRLRFLLVLAIGSITCSALTAGNPPDDIDTRFKKDLSVQTAMARARLLLGDSQAQKAVEVLEEQLRNVNGNSVYLLLLRDAYRAYIRDLYLAGRPEQAKRYLDRLCILDPGAANDAALSAPPRQFEPDPMAAKQTNPFRFPDFNPLKLTNPFVKKAEPTKPPVIQPSVARAVPQEQSIVDDPFDGKNQREGTLDASKAALARELLTRGAAEFRNDRFAEAKVCFEQAYQSDASSLDACKEQWAYCILKGVSDAMEQPGVLPGRLPELQQQVEGAIRMAPTKMMASGQQLLEQLERRAKQNGGPPQITASAAKRHWGQNKEGWQVVETVHFRIFHRQDSDFGERVAQIAESTRGSMFKKWFGHDGVEWEPICELIMHPSAASYTQMTSVPGNSPGHSRIESDPSGRIVARRMDMRMDGPGILEAVLPHETTHVVLAGMFGNAPVPRWADEGIAVLTEPDDKVAQHRRNLHKHHQEGQLFGLKELMELKDYPQSRKISAFYAQSVALCEFLTAQRDAKTLTDFVKDGIRQGYETALQRHYNLTFTQLEERWTQQVLNNPGRAAMK
jgi:tetratricopeptide (TPR) repeat protein